MFTVAFEDSTVCIVLNSDEDLTQLTGQLSSFIKRIVDCMSDDKLQDLAFSTFVRRVASLLAGANISDPVVEKQKYAVQLLWELVKKSNCSLKRIYATYMAEESCLIIFTLEAMCTNLESYCKYITSQVAK